MTSTFSSNLTSESCLRKKTASSNGLFIEIGPRLNFSTAYSTNAVSICKAVGLGHKIARIERSTLYLITFKVKKNIKDKWENIKQIDFINFRKKLPTKLNHRLLHVCMIE